MFKGAIFDVDGTILDSMWVWEEATSGFARKRGVEMTEAELAQFKDMTLEESMPIIKERFSLENTIEELKAEFARLCAEEYRLNVKPKPYAKEYIKSLKERGVKIAIATSGYRELCETALTRLGIMEYIDAFAFSSEVGVNKRNPDVYLLAAERIGVEPEKCMVFEDILAGVFGAKAGGMQVTAIFDKSSAEVWGEIKENADRAIMSWEELL